MSHILIAMNTYRHMVIGLGNEADGSHIVIGLGNAHGNSHIVIGHIVIGHMIIGIDTDRHTWYRHR